MRRLLSPWTLWFALVASCAGTARHLDIRPAELPADQREEAAVIVAAYEREPDDAAALYQIASLLATSGRTDDALEALRRMAAFGTGIDPRVRDGFESIAAHPEFQRIVADIRAKHPPVLAAREMFTLEERDLFPEGIAWSAKKERFYLGSTKRKIIAVDARGHAETFIAPAKGGLGVVLGLRVDDVRGDLWAVSMRLNGEPADGLEGLLRVRLDDGEVVGRYEAKDSLNDVAVTPDGTAYATMTGAGQLLRVDGATGRVDKVLAPGAIPFANGIAVAPSGRALYVASWRDIYRVELPSLLVSPLPKPKNVVSGCCDGLYVRGNDLVGVQNCVHATGRVVRFHLDSSGVRIVNASVLESYNPLFDGVTTGAIANDALVFVANIQFRKRGKSEPFNPLHVLTLPLGTRMDREM
jgi:sugar lactone lactonase YvrE